MRSTNQSLHTLLQIQKSPQTRSASPGAKHCIFRLKKQPWNIAWNISKNLQKKLDSSQQTFALHSRKNAQKPRFPGVQIAKSRVKRPSLQVRRKPKFGFRQKMLYLCTTEEKATRFSPFFGLKMAKTTFDVVKTSSKVVKITSDVVFTTSDIVNKRPDFYQKNTHF